MTNDIINKELVNKIESLLKNAREKVVREVNNTLLITYMEIGKAIVEDEKLHIDDIEYEKMKANAIKIGKRLRRGFYTKRAMKKALSEL